MDYHKLLGSIFPQGTSFNFEVKAMELAKKFAYDFDFSQAAEDLLDRKHFDAFEEADGPCWAAYREAIDSYGKSKDTEEEEWAIYKDREEPIWANYIEAVAIEFARQYWRQENGL